MRVLLLFRGAPGCGKSTFIDEHGLRPYTLSADEIRLLCQSNYLTPDGTIKISQENDNLVWNTLFQILETRMKHGEFTVIDATNSKTKEMKRYKELCDNYRYRIYCIDMTDVPVDVVKERNRNREEFKQVPENVIDLMYTRFASQKIPAGITVLKPDELDKIWMNPRDVSTYKKVNVIGDIHGCNTALQEYFKSIDGLHDDELYIFSGDYLDRGIENVDVLRFLLSIYKRENVIFLEGNHERWLWVWGNDGVCPSKEFEIHTRSQLEAARIDKKEVRKFYRKLGQCAYLSFAGKTLFVCHGGVSFIPDNLTFVSAEQMIKGVGSYGDADKVSETFANLMPDSFVQIHGHRNLTELPVKVNDQVFNLEGHVEFGGHLRAVQFDESGSSKEFEIKNDVFREIAAEEKSKASEKQDVSIGDVIIQMRQNKFISEKRYGNISSFNFTKTAFFDRVWDEQTMKARGLYINVPEEKIVARAYDKFFNINERPNVSLEMLQYRFKFPLTAYVKENGFLGIVSYDHESEDLFVTTKSNPTGDFANWFKNLLFEKADIDELTAFAKENDVSLVFECVDMTRDPHIIEYPSSEIFLLDIVSNKLDFEKLDYDSMCQVARTIGVKHKERAYEISDWQSFIQWYNEVSAEGFMYHGRPIEGFVIEDTENFMVKLKTDYYTYWKHMRSIAHETIKHGHTRRTGSLQSAESQHFYDYLKHLWETFEDRSKIPTNICALRRMFMERNL